MGFLSVAPCGQALESTVADQEVDMEVFRSQVHAEAEATEANLRNVIASLSAKLEEVQV